MASEIPGRHVELNPMRDVTVERLRLLRWLPEASGLTRPAGSVPTMEHSTVGDERHAPGELVHVGRLILGDGVDEEPTLDGHGQFYSLGR
jgi:hypothetical protein